MSVYTTEKISDHDFKIYHAIYSQENIFMSYDWKERVELSEPDGCGFLLAKDGIAVGGAIYRDNHVTCPFLIAPFCDKYEFWNELLRLWKVRDDKLFLDFIPESYCEPLEKAGAKKKRGQCRMLRPTTKENVLLRGTSHKEVSLWHFKEFVMMVGYGEFVGITKYIGGNYNEIII